MKLGIREAKDSGEWPGQYGQAPVSLRTPRTMRLLRDLDGYVHTPNGFMRGELYDKMRATLPDFNYPERSSIPLMTELSDADLEAWYAGEVPAEVKRLRQVL